MIIGSSGFPRHRAAASLKLDTAGAGYSVTYGFPRHRAAASLKREHRSGRCRRDDDGFPRHRAAASLKQRVWRGVSGEAMGRFSAASGRGLIEAIGSTVATSRGLPVFRGIGPRPH